MRRIRIPSGDMCMQVAIGNKGERHSKTYSTSHWPSKAMSLLTIGTPMSHIGLERIITLHAVAAMQCNHLKLVASLLTTSIVASIAKVCLRQDPQHTLESHPPATASTPGPDCSEPLGSIQTVRQLSVTDGETEIYQKQTVVTIQ